MTAGYAGARTAHRRFDPSRPTTRSALIALGIAGLLALLIVSPSIGGHGPGDPAAVATDARIARCGGTVTDMEYAFTIPHAREYQRYLPAMGRFSELELEKEALVIIYRGPFPGLKAQATSAPTPPPDDTRNVCIYVGKAGQGELNYYRSISIAGLRVTLGGPMLVPAAQT